MRHRNVHLLVFAAAVLAALLAAKRPAAAQSIEIEIRNVTHDLSFGSVIAWTHSSWGQDLVRTLPSQPLRDLSRSLPAAGFAQLALAHRNTHSLVRDTEPIRPGESRVIEVRAGRLYWGYSVLLPLEAQDGFAYLAGLSPHSGKESMLAHAWEAGGHVWIHRNVQGPVIVATVSREHASEDTPQRSREWLTGDAKDRSGCHDNPGQYEWRIINQPCGGDGQPACVVACRPLGD